MANSKILEKNTEDKIRRYLSAVQRSGIDVSEVRVFGSRVNGDFDNSSDIDLAIVSSQFGGDRHADLVNLFKLVDRETSEIEPIPLSPEDIKDAADPLVREIVENGIIFASKSARDI